MHESELSLQANVDPYMRADFFLSFGEFWEKTTLTHIGGYFGLATAAAAWYGTLAGVTNSTYKDTVVPVGPRA